MTMERWRMAKKGIKPWMVWKSFRLFNQSKGWKHMPLTLDDIRETVYSFRLVREFPWLKETQETLQGMLEEGVIKKAYCYYAPANWETRRQSIEHLAMIRATCDFLSKYGYWVKPLPASGYKEKGVPDVIAVRKRDNPRIGMNIAIASTEGRLLVECETGKKHLYGALDEWLAETMIKKIDALLEKEEDVYNKSNNSLGIMFVLTKKLFDAFLRLYRREHPEIMKRIQMLGRDQLRIYNVESILPK
jgi:hypothetical protein